MPVSQNLYELIALGARYVFAGLMVLIVARAWRLTVVDSRRAQTLRRISPETGLSGELIVMEGDEKARRGMRYPVIREGMIGSSRRSDVRIRHSSVRRKHAWFELTDDGLRLRANGRAPLYDRFGRVTRELTLRDGDIIDIGHVRLMLVLTEAPEPARPVHRREERRHDRRPSREAPPRRRPRQDDPDRLFEENPILNRMPENRTPEPPEDPDDLFDVDE